LKISVALVVLVMATAAVVVERDLKSAANGTVNFPSKELLPLPARWNIARGDPHGTLDNTVIGAC